MSSFAPAFTLILQTLLAFFASTISNENVTSSIRELKLKNAVSCTPGQQMIYKLLTETSNIPLMPGSGEYVWKINTKSDSAQLYFNQGINMYYGFHIIEAIASFKKATQFDPSNAMLWWAQSLAAGPNINDIGYAASPETLEATAKSVGLSINGSDVEKALIQAMTARYSADSTKTRKELNEAYVDAMKNVYFKFPNNVDVITLYADAMMLQHPWDLWAADGTPQSWEPLIQSTLEKAIGENPKHPGANHYYIHVMEASPTPGKALPSANILGSLTPGLAHLVHMPSHIYLRTGAYNTGIENNIAAIKTFKNYERIFPPSAGNTFIYYWHNLHMLSNCAMLEGKYAEAIKAANELKDLLDTASLSSPGAIGSYLQYMYMTPTIINIRFEKWDSILKVAEPDTKYIYANILYHFGRGMALASMNKIDSAEKHANAMKVLMQDSVLLLRIDPFSPAMDGANVALEILNGSIYLHGNNNTKAIAHFKKAAEREWNIVYNEPRDWMLNPYPYLGNVYLRVKNYNKAEEAFRKDLSRNANNSWAVKGLEIASKMQRRVK